ncbi:hypothetical protein B0H14DRAFT_3501829 [Mycena olivaceomarginata]|nr:hypothetical protein B0H14DRAFT_3501829 [Mycena olivaceomarginata]
MASLKDAVRCDLPSKPGSATTAATPSAISSSSEEAAPPVEDDVQTTPHAVLDDASPEDTATSAENNAQTVPQAVTSDAQAVPPAVPDDTQTVPQITDDPQTALQTGLGGAQAHIRAERSEGSSTPPIDTSGGRASPMDEDVGQNTLLTPTSLLLSTPPVPVTAPADLPSEKHHVVLGLLKSEIKLPTWVAAVQAWCALETVTGFQTSGKALPSRRCPSAVSWWINCARKTSQVPAGIDGDDNEQEDFYAAVISWWLGQEGNGNLDALPTGLNGLTSFMACLWWWYQIAC